MTTLDGSPTTLRRRAVLAIAAAALGLAAVTSAQGAPRLVDLTVVDRETGEPLQVWRHEGRLFVAGRPGARYSLRITNNTAGRVLVVPSVDGVNVLTGETAGYSQRGYVFDPYETYDVSGWRKSDTEVAAFKFAPLPQSYAARTGRPGDVGVIGVAVFRERFFAPMPAAPAAKSNSRSRDDSDRASEAVVTTQRRESSRAGAPPPAVRAQPQDEEVIAERRSEKLGTAHGGREWSYVRTVPFERATSSPQLVRRIEYDSYDNLVAMGVIPPSWEPGHRPRPFPSNRGYVPAPPDEY